jgi:hypothetical protein
MVAYCERQPSLKEPIIDTQFIETIQLEPYKPIPKALCLLLLLLFSQGRQTYDCSL